VEELIAALLDDRQVVDLIHDQQAWSAEEADALLEPTFPFRTGKRADQVSERREVYALSGFHGFDAQRFAR